MTLLFSLLFVLIVTMYCSRKGAEKGYDALLCGVGGFVGGIVAVIVILLLPDRAVEQEQHYRERSSYTNEIAELRRRVAALEAAVKTLMPEPEKTPAALPASEAGAETIPTAAVFSSRALGTVACPHCGRKQQSDRDRCYNCGTPFVYENEN